MKRYKHKKYIKIDELEMIWDFLVEHKLLNSYLKWGEEELTNEEIEWCDNKYNEYNE